MANSMDTYGGYTGKTFNATGFFRIEKDDDRWWLVDPEGHPFFIIGIAHVDDATMKYDHNISIYKERYGSRKKWISDCVVKSLKEWGFNTIAWTKEWVTPGLRHSPEWTPEEYRNSGLAYIPHIDFLSIERWNRQSVYVDVFGKEFEEWCDYQARYWCVSLADDPKLIGYAYTARPCWVFAEFCENSWFEGIDPRTKAGRDQLAKVIRQYYKTTHDAIRRYDKNHLILGDLIEGNDNLPQDEFNPPIEAFSQMCDFVDVMSINWYQRFDVMKESVEAWQEICKKPIFFSDSGFVAPTDILPENQILWEGARVRTQKDRGTSYAEFVKKAAASKSVIGWGWCSFMENLTRRYGLKNRFDEPYEECTNIMKEFNEDFYHNIGWDK